ncbi:hypothetical protein HID58_044407 [Brassica napus]|uniref:Mannosyl-glycoprotein endo-beta-N-acetylglucosaminidase n=2 Tax=Brassica napus TaxID=3708 RepID=A0ABQ8BJD9_BRANA|nr:hypothetical protein HID58_044407 [Brassica napus]
MKGFWNLTSTISLPILFLFGYNYEDVYAVPTTCLCHPEQRDALLQLKNEFEVLNSSFDYDYCISYDIKPHRKTESWVNNNDCCTWDGIMCNPKSGDVIELDLGLVPGGTQFRRLNCTSFEDNPGLFGPSLEEICRDIHMPRPHETPESDEEEEVLSWIAAETRKRRVTSPYFHKPSFLVFNARRPSSRRTLVSLYNLFFTLSHKLLTSFPLSLIMPKPNDAEAVPLLDLSKPSTPISFPIKSLQDLESRSYFDSFHFQFNRSTVPLRGDLPNNRPRVLVCHDMKGGYVDDKWVQGCENDAGYAIWHWYLMDVFVYFSHSLVTIPPPCWTNTAHRHGVKVLGTFITEWDEGKTTCNEMLATKESAQMYAERLAELATSLGFDGWLINIENEIDKEQVPNLMEFVSHLTKVLHLSTPGSLVIWYDSVTVHDHLKWQDHLNEKNKRFFDLCDGIFMNYTWKESYPKLSAEVAGDRKYDVYMGIDVFGRGSFGGGQWTVDTALDLLKRNNVSAAIFAPGWVYETAQPPNFHTAQNKSRKVLEKPRSERVFLGISHVPAYYVSELVVDSDVKGVSFVVQPCGEDGLWRKLDDSPNLLVDLEGLS